MPPPSIARSIDGIVIGASAGGVEALTRLLPTLPRTMRASVFVVLHLPRERPSLLVDLFAPRCAVPVREAADKELVEPGTVYVAPPDYHLLLDQGPQLALSVDELVNYSRPSIDVLFQSAADVYRHRLLGIILTGANEDGASGLAAVRAAGGLTIVQRPDTAHSPQMALFALQRTTVDYVLSLDEIADVFRTLTEDRANACAGKELG
jgi:two-component system chemotaxis response regulator CheB